ncbi:hypothetical protein [Lentzea cavernae]|uniref:DUF4034 domain-containing protein n=1 Tax=Lentzea cavernae TaxID=2020703 RepID=A0ABQ3MQR7_9PSEU|nr:hypothetical protein [Lentzea cavernae]GHH57197.1 hypothetical protein GCM10017774_76400 [Lentzea cavernae]
MPQLPPYVDTTFDDDELLRAVVALVSGDLEPALGFLAATRDDPYRRELAVDVLGAAGNAVLPALFAAGQERPDDVNLLLLLGVAQSTAGWESRGGAWAKDTSDEQFDGLVTYTRRARDTLHRAAALDPGDVAPWAALMSVALGAPTHRGEAAEVYAEVVKRVPDLVNATLRRLQSTALKWYGSHEEMLAFARSGVAGLPDGHPLLSLVPIAHVEVHLKRTSSGGRLSQAWQVLTTGYLKKQRAEVDAASDRLLAGAGGQPHSLWAHQIFAVYYYEVGAADRLARHLPRAGERVMRWPWGYFGNPAERFRKAHALASAG